METTRRRRWWQFGLLAILYVTLVVAAYFAGRVHRDREMRDQVRQSEMIAETEAAHARDLERKLDEARIEINTLRIVQRMEPVELDFRPQQ